MHGIDFAIIIIWLLIVLGIGMKAGINVETEGFWINRRRTKTFSLVATIVATQIGGGTIIGIASSSYSSGTGFGIVALASTFTGFLAIAWFAPWAKRFGDRISAYTLPEVFGERYGRATHIASSIIIIFAYLSLLAGQLLAISTLLWAWIGFSPIVSMILAAGGVIAYSAFAGLRGDVITDIIHCLLSHSKNQFHLFS